MTDNGGEILKWIDDRLANAESALEHANRGQIDEVQCAIGLLLTLREEVEWLEEAAAIAFRQRDGGWRGALLGRLRKIRERLGLTDD